METIIKTVVVYFIVFLVLRLSGRRTLGQLTSFDLVVMLIIGGATQRALLGQDYSVTNAVLVVVTLVVIDVLISLIERDSRFAARIFNGSPMIVVEQGRVLHDRIRKARLTEAQILAAARRIHGIERLADIKFAILEASGAISIIPASPAPRA
jgi:uncharacterized membrane protein YcaP (DUF421 family)